MVSSVLTQAILGQQAPDILGSFRKGQEIARQRDIRKFSALAAEGDEDAIRALTQLDPATGLQFKERGRQEAIRRFSAAAFRGEEGALEEVANLAPDVAFSLAEKTGARDAQSLNDFIKSASIASRMLEGGDVQGTLSFVRSRQSALKRKGADTTQTDKILNLLETGETGQALAELKAFGTAIEDTKKTSRQLEFEQFQSLPEGSDKESFGKLIGVIDKPEAGPGRTRQEREFNFLVRAGGFTPQQAQDAALIEAGLKAPASRRKGVEEAGDIARAETEQRELVKGASKRLTSTVQQGVEAADSISILKRALTLAKSVKTGGIRKSALSAFRFFGAESPDDAELDNLLGIAVLQQIKPIFGAAPSEKEGKMLVNLESGFGKGAAANIRIIEQKLKQLNRIADRGIEAAKQISKKLEPDLDPSEDFTVKQIKQALEFNLAPGSQVADNGGVDF